MITVAWKMKSFAAPLQLLNLILFTSLLISGNFYEFLYLKFIFISMINFSLGNLINIYKRRKKGNLGYAFVNFTCWEGASRLYNAWKGLMKWENCGYATQKICHIDHAKLQVLWNYI